MRDTHSLPTIWHVYIRLDGHLFRAINKYTQSEPERAARKKTEIYQVVELRIEWEGDVGGGRRKKSGMSGAIWLKKFPCQLKIFCVFFFFMISCFCHFRCVHNFLSRFCMLYSNLSVHPFSLSPPDVLLFGSKSVQKQRRQQKESSIAVVREQNYIVCFSFSSFSQCLFLFCIAIPRLHGCWIGFSLFHFVHFVSVFL